ncbi:adenosylcobinamide-phosphate synthase CbiB [Halalkalibacterium halodurans]|uniref:adenosylcobinamide-phosphate synthase CbiB n=1 Tax=Halalkalibacterium halodurans TaxID=86665 RepID=UPI0010684EE4|nr:adenosylcobinamide-phosphate synthase CbiB [Halalkalibacterium halodurans]MED3646774.1 adenosylcobinamide-phosphate synthase CbiB [Halalkalibacterium halodurans]TES56343.1 cobalamin biosynthesis protein [Halalkalibacterium halodurans]
MIACHVIAIVSAFILDKWLGDPKWLPHPVVGMGKLITYFERRWNCGRWRREKGVLLLLTVLLIVTALSLALVWLSYQVHLLLGVIVEALLIASTIAAKGLKEAAEEVARPLTTRNLLEARRKLSYIVGRDTDQLDEKEIARGAIETVAENTSDGVTAPLFYALIGGAPLALLYRATNTCDSMVGYKNERYRDFGWASAKFDDVLNWVPSRITGVLMLLLHRKRRQAPLGQSLKMLAREAKKHPSPNSGWGEAAMALLLHVTLGGTNTYQGMTSERAKMGYGTKAMTAKDIDESIAIMNRTVLGFLVFLFLLGGFIYAIT